MLNLWLFPDSLSFLPWLPFACLHVSLLVLYLIRILLRVLLSFPLCSFFIICCFSLYSPFPSPSLLYISLPPSPSPSEFTCNATQPPPGDHPVIIIIITSLLFSFLL